LTAWCQKRTDNNAKKKGENGFSHIQLRKKGTSGREKVLGIDLANFFSDKQTEHAKLGNRARALAIPSPKWAGAPNDRWID
jgi:hypothetical protein